MMTMISMGDQLAVCCLWVSRESRVDLNPPKRGVEFNLNPPKKLPICSRQSKETISIIDFCDTWIISPLRLDRLAVVSCIFHHTVTSCLLPSSLPRIHPSHSIRWSGTKCYLIMCWSVQSEILVVGVARTSRSSEPSPLHRAAASKHQATPTRAFASSCMLAGVTTCHCNHPLVPRTPDPSSSRSLSIRKLNRKGQWRGRSKHQDIVHHDGLSSLSCGGYS